MFNLLSEGVVLTFNLVPILLLLRDLFDKSGWLLECEQKGPRVCSENLSTLAPSPLASVPGVLSLNLLDIEGTVEGV